MDVTFALPGTAHFGGGLRVVAQYAEHLRNSGHRVRLLVRQPDELISRKRKLLRQIGLAPKRPLPDLNLGFFEPLGLELIHLDRDKPVRASDVPDADILVATWWTTAEWSHQLPRSKGIKAQFVQGHEVFPYLPQDRVIAVQRLPNQKISISSGLRDTLMKLYGVDSHVVPNGVDLDLFAPGSMAKRDPQAIGFVWSDATCKNMSLAVAAICEARSRRPGLKVRVFGGRDHPASLPDWVEFERQPPQQRIAEIYGSCRAWLFTSDEEGFGLPILEALACGTPVLGTCAGAAQDLIASNNGKLLPSSATAFADEIVRIIDMPDDDWQAMSMSARATGERHSLAQSAERFEAALHQIIRSSAPEIGLVV